MKTRGDKAISLPEAMAGSVPLSALAARLRQSRERFAAVSPLLGEALAPQVQPGPIDEAGWTLLAASPAVAAKLRQLLPLLQERLEQSGFRTIELRVKVVRD